MTDKTVLITGGNSGIGLCIAHEVAQRGATVALACRNQAKAAAARHEILQRTPGAKVELYELDLASFDKIRRFATAFSAKHGKLDALINNAGGIITKQQFTADGFEMQFGANYLGPFLLTHLLLPQLQQAADQGGAGRGDARIVHLSSIAHTLGRMKLHTAKGRKPYFAFPSYAQSKLGNLMFSNALARRLPQGITSQALHPGGVASAFYRDIPGWQYLFLKPFLIGPDPAARLVTKLALDPAYKGKTGDYFSVQHPKIITGLARDVARQDELYAKSCEWTGLQPLNKR